mgnify:CR=1 FL=1
MLSGPGDLVVRSLDIFLPIATSENSTEVIVVELGGVCTVGKLEFVSTVKTLANVSAKQISDQLTILGDTSTYVS